MTGLTLAVRALLTSRKARENALIVLLSAFLSFTLARYLYTVGGAEPRTDGRQVFLSFCASISLSVATIQLFLGLALTRRPRGGCGSL